MGIRQACMHTAATHGFVPISQYSCPSLKQEEAGTLAHLLTCLFTLRNQNHICLSYCFFTCEKAYAYSLWGIGHGANIVASAGTPQIPEALWMRLGSYHVHS
jgi:hypothetical protein